VASSCQFQFLRHESTARLKRTGEGLASDSDQSDVYVCPAKERAGMKCNPSRSGTRNLADELAELRGLNPPPLGNAGGCSTALKRRSTSARLFCFKQLPIGCRKEFLAALNPPPAACSSGPAEDSLHRQTPSEAPATKVTPGSVLIREWHGVSHRVTVLGDGVLLRGARYRSLSEVARKITGTRWSGPRFFGLRAPTKRSEHGTH